MKKWNEKTKQRITAGGLTILGIGLIIGISMQLKMPANRPAETMVTIETETTMAVMIETEPDTETITQAVASEEAITEKENQETESMETEEKLIKEADTKPAAVQNIQPDVTKPATQADVNDPTQKPDGTKLESAPVPVPHEEVITPTEDPEQLQGGETNSSGQVYVPGFGWCTPSGGEGSYAADMYENGNKIGSMN